MSFIYLGIYWSNHHHLLHAAEHVNGAVLWANLHLLFWLSLIPFTTAWMGETHFTQWPVAAYGLVLVCSAFAYQILANALLTLHGRDSLIATALGRDFKGKVSVGINVVALPLAFLRPWLALACYGIVAVIWLIPDRRIERRLAEQR